MEMIWNLELIMGNVRNYLLFSSRLRHYNHFKIFIHPIFKLSFILLLKTMLKKIVGVKPQTSLSYDLEMKPTLEVKCK